jgi:hypothetical protein
VTPTIGKERLLAEGDSAVTGAEIVNAIFALPIASSVFMGIRPSLARIRLLTGIEVESVAVRC